MPSLLCELALLLQTISNVPLDSLFTHTPLSSVHMFKVLHFLIPHRLEFLRKGVHLKQSRSVAKVIRPVSVSVFWVHSCS